MKKLSLLCAFILITSLYGCHSSVANVSQEPVSTPTPANSTANGDTSDTEDGPASEERIFTKDFDGIELTVILDKGSYTLDSLIGIQAKVKNNTDETIYLFVPTSSPNTHLEISTQVTMDNVNYLIDRETYGKGYDLGTFILSIDPGDEYVQNMQFETYYGRGGIDKELASAGVYKGTAAIMLESDPQDMNSTTTTYTLEFKLEITE